MSILSLLIAALAGAGAVIYLLMYLPLVSKFAGKTYSPRLMACKVLAPFDAGVTLFLVAGSWIGISTVVTGIGMMIFNVMTGIGISFGVLIVRKILVPKWRDIFEKEIRL